jgi:hypothetical protein
MVCLKQVHKIKLFLLECFACIYVCSGDVVQILVHCLSKPDAKVCHASLLAIKDLYMTFGDTMLPYTQNDTNPKAGLLLPLLVKAAGNRRDPVTNAAYAALK